MSKSYGMMVGFDTAIDWIERNTPDDEMKQRVMARLQYERDQNVPVPPNRFKGRFTFAIYSCGNCGRTVEVQDKYCPGCGFVIDWRAR